MKKILGTVLIVAFLLCGCSDYKRNMESGETREITLAQMETMMHDKKDFIVVFTQSTCGYCKEFHEMFEVYQNDHHVVLYEVPLEKEEASPVENLALIQQYFPDFHSTPGIFYARDGNCVDAIDVTQKINMQSFDNWIQKNKLDK